MFISKEHMRRCRQGIPDLGLFRDGHLQLGWQYKAALREQDRDSIF